MKIIILAAGQGTRLRPLTDDRPKCMVELNKKSLLFRQLEVMKEAGIREEDIYVLAGYRSEYIEQALKHTKIHMIVNKEYAATNMVYTLMCAERLFQDYNDIIVSYGDIVYRREVLKTLLKENEAFSVVVDDGWYPYWENRCENPLDDAETLIMDEKGYLKEIGQKTTDRSKIQSQYIGLMRFQAGAEKKVLELARKAKQRSREGKPLWRTDRSYSKMYMTDLLQGLIDEENQIKAVRINRGWYEVDCYKDLKLAETEIDW